jgi:hypothetical protein
MHCGDRAKQAAHRHRLKGSIKLEVDRDWWKHPSSRADANHRARNDGEIYAGTGAAARAAGIGLNINMIRNAPSPMIQEPI